MKIFYQSLYASTKQEAGVPAFTGTLQSVDAYHKVVLPRLQESFKKAGMDFHAVTISKEFFSNVLNLKEKDSGNKFTHALVQNLLAYSLGSCPPDIICMGECLFQDIENKEDFSLVIAGKTYNLEAYERDGTQGNKKVPANNAFAVWVKEGIKTNEIIIYESLVRLEYKREDESISKIAFVHTPNSVYDPKKQKVSRSKITTTRIRHYYEKNSGGISIQNYDIIMGDTNQKEWGQLAKGLNKPRKKSDPKPSYKFIGREIKQEKTSRIVKGHSLASERDFTSEAHGLNKHGLSTGGGDGSSFDTVIVKSIQASTYSDSNETERIVYTMVNGYRVKMLGYSRRFFEGKDIDNLENNEKKKHYIVTDHMGVMVDEYSKSSTGDKDTEPEEKMKTEETLSTTTLRTKEKENRKRPEPDGGKDDSSQPTSNRQKLNEKDVDNK